MNDEALFNTHTASRDRAKSVGARLIVVLLLVIAAVVPMWNLVIDPYDVFGTRILRHSADPNERFRKVEVLLGQRDQGVIHDALVIGASTAGAFRVRDLETTFPDRRFYNLALRSAHLTEIHDLLRFHHHSVHPLQQVVLTVDLFQFVEPAKQGGFLTQHPAVSDQSRLAFFWGQLWASSLLGGLNKVKASMSDQTFLDVDWASGEYRYSPERRMSAVESAWKVRERFKPVAIRASAIDQLARIAQWCASTNISLVVLASPRADGADATLREKLSSHPTVSILLVLPPSVAKEDFHDATHFTSDYAERWLKNVGTMRSNF